MCVCVCAIDCENDSARFASKGRFVVGASLEFIALCRAK